jgi:PilZ domain-containing protein
VVLIKRQQHCGITTLAHFANPPSDLSWTHGAQRAVPRYSMLAVAELAETASTMCIVGRMTEISRNGCYVNTPNTLPVNTSLRVVISSDDETFMTNGKVIYVHEGIGMGIVFVDPAEDQVEVLNSWLADAS